MKFIFPKNDDKYEWTHHSVRKMLFYGISENRIRRILKNPKRIEKGIAENTTAVMQPSSSKHIGKKEIWSQEIWVMYQQKNKNKKSKSKNRQNFEKKVIISAWRYPGVTKLGKEIPIPEEIISELKISRGFF